MDSLAKKQYCPHVNLKKKYLIPPEILLCSHHPGSAQTDERLSFLAKEGDSHFRLFLLMCQNTRYCSRSSTKDSTSQTQMLRLFNTGATISTSAVLCRSTEYPLHSIIFKGANDKP